MRIRGNGPLIVIQFQIGRDLLHELLNSLHNVEICMEPSIIKGKYIIKAFQKRRVNS